MTMKRVREVDFGGKHRVLDVLRKVQRHLCAYKSEKFCDCKFGGTEIGGHREQGNGCPEVRMAIYFIKNVSSADFAHLIHRQVR